MELRIRKPFNGQYPITFRFWEAPDWYLARGWGSHKGVDFGVPVGTPVMAVDDGEVIEDNYDPGGWGHYVRVKHEWGMSHYAHLLGTYVKVGDKIKKGQMVGPSGETGFCTGPHLHFGMKLNVGTTGGLGEWVDPLLYIDMHDESINEEKKIDKGIKYYICPKCGEQFTEEQWAKSVING